MLKGKKYVFRHYIKYVEYYTLNKRHYINYTFKFKG